VLAGTGPCDGRSRVLPATNTLVGRLFPFFASVPLFASVSRMAVLMRVLARDILERSVPFPGSFLRPRPRMLDQLNPEAIFLQHLAWIDRMASFASRKHGRRDADAEDFASWAKMRLIEDDYAVFRKFRGEADWKTFIATVMVRLSVAYSREQQGRWRPSTAAVRRGTPARELEALVLRDGYTVAQAGEKLRTAGVTRLTDRELAQLLDELPTRGPMRLVEVAADPVLEGAEGPSHADERVAEAEARTEHGALLDALRRAMNAMPYEDRMIVFMHFGEGRTLAHVARALNIDQKPLYRRIPKLRDVLRANLEREGVSGRDVRMLLDREDS
jgi:RNA polymerase sigma factor (sigma-70 family)